MTTKFGPCLLTLQWLPLPEKEILQLDHQIGGKMGLFNNTSFWFNPINWGRERAKKSVFSKMVPRRC